MQPEAAANTRRDALMKLGIKDATIQSRDNSATRVVLRMRDLPQSIANKLTSLRHEFGGSELRDC